MATFPEEIGRRAYRRILEIIQDDREKQSPETILIPTKFIEGESVRPPKQKG
jgi:DNA-binding LacI/PurR family transcriptional regulator